MPRPEDKPHPHDPGYEKPGNPTPGREGAPGQQKPRPDQELPEEPDRDEQPGRPHPDQTLPGDLEDEDDGVSQR